MKENRKWNFKDIYENEEKFKEDEEELKSILEEVSKYKGKVTTKKENLLQIFKLYEKALEKGIGQKIEW